MNIKVKKKAGWVLGMLAFSMVLLLILPSAGFAVVCDLDMPVDDADLDGFLDHEECYGFAYTNIIGDIVTVFGMDSELDRKDRLDPDTPDLFVYIQYDNSNPEPSRLENMPNLFRFIEKSNLDNGLAITSHHLLVPPLYDTQVKGFVMGPTTGQKAMWIAENAQPRNSTVLGVSPQGPITLDDVKATVYTGVIAQAVYNIYNDNGVSVMLSDLNYYTELLIENTLVHEAGHLLDLAEIFTKKGKRLIHFPQQDVLMDAEVEVSIRKSHGTKVVRWNLPDVWDPTSQELYELNELKR